MHRIVNDEALDILFRKARGAPAWLSRPVGDTLLRALWELVQLGPGNSGRCHSRLLFVRSDGARTALAAALPAELRDGLAAAPAAAIVGRPIEKDPEAEAAALRQSAAKSAGLIIAARALGLDCAPFWEFDARQVAAQFFADSGAAAEFVCGLGYGDRTQPSAGEPHHGLEGGCTIL